MTVDLPFEPHQCPRCELRFRTRSELDDHVAVDHRLRLRLSPALAETIAARVAAHHQPPAEVGR